MAPMGEGVYVFECRPQEDNVTYDLLDKYIMETLDRAQVIYKTQTVHHGDPGQGTGNIQNTNCTSWRPWTGRR